MTNPSQYPPKVPAMPREPVKYIQRVMLKKFQGEAIDGDSGVMACIRQRCNAIATEVQIGS